MSTTNKFLLWQQPGSALTDFIADLALEGRVSLLMAGEQFAFYGLVRQIRRRTPNLTQVLERITAARAFTPYQLLGLLQASAAQSQPDVWIVLDLLNQFSDSSLALTERKRLLGISLLQIQQLHNRVPLIVTQSARRSSPETKLLHEILWRASEIINIKPGYSLNIDQIF